MKRTLDLYTPTWLSNLRESHSFPSLTRYKDSGRSLVGLGRLKQRDQSLSGNNDQLSNPIWHQAS